MSKPFKPMLAAKAPHNALDINFPAVASPKLDGIRCVIRDGVALSRSLKPIPNKEIQEFFSDGKFNGLDGELIVGEHHEGVFKRTTSFVMSKDKTGEPWQYWVFDCTTHPDWSFNMRLQKAYDVVGYPAKVSVVNHVVIHTPKELDSYEHSILAAGYEGVMLRDPSGPYKYGRSTAKQGGLLKVKRFQDAEATVVGFKERLRNGNEARKNAVGATERSTSKAGLIPAGDLGALRVVGDNGVEFDIGSGFTAAERESLWSVRESLVGRLLTYQYFELTESGAPRFPTFKGFRDRRDT